MGTASSAPVSVVSQMPFWAFNCAYLLFMAPVVYPLCSIYRDRDGLARVTPLPQNGLDPVVSMGATILFIGWMGVLCMALCVALTFLGWKQRVKAPATHKDDFARMCYLHISLAYVARVNARLVSPPYWFFPLLVAYFATFFSLLFEMIRHVNLHLSSDLWRNPRGMWITAVGALVLVGVMHAHMCMAWAQGPSFGFAYGAWVVLALLGHAAVWAVPPSRLRGSNAGGHGFELARLHVHHWYWAFLAAHFPIFDTALSCVSQALLLGVYIHGAACFGLETIFQPCQP